MKMNETMKQMTSRKKELLLKVIELKKENEKLEGVLKIGRNANQNLSNIINGLTDDDGNPLPDAEKRYPHYDNYAAINVDKVADIPVDYQGVMGVPITFLDKLNRKQFQIVGITRPLINGKYKYSRILIQAVK